MHAHNPRVYPYIQVVNIIFRVKNLMALSHDNDEYVEPCYQNVSAFARL